LPLLSCYKIADVTRSFGGERKEGKKFEVYGGGNCLNRDAAEDLRAVKWGGRRQGCCNYIICIMLREEANLFLK
jgi:hypothetical protein